MPLPRSSDADLFPWSERDDLGLVVQFHPSRQWIRHTERQKINSNLSRLTNHLYRMRKSQSVWVRVRVRNSSHLQSGARFSMGLRACVYQFIHTRTKSIPFSFSFSPESILSPCTERRPILSFSSCARPAMLRSRSINSSDSNLSLLPSGSPSIC